MKIYTYHEPLGMERQHKLLDEWHKRWSACGFEPVVLNRTQASLHPRYNEYLAAVNHRPTVNPRNYENACWVRWLALAVAGGGLMADSDVIPNPYAGMVNPDEVTKLPKAAAFASSSGDVLKALFEACSGELIFFDKGWVPCLVNVPGEEMVQVLGSRTDHIYYANRPHCSDMTVVQSAKPGRSLPIVDEFGNENWMAARIIHFAAGACAKHGDKPNQPKAELMQKHLPL